MQEAVFIDEIKNRFRGYFPVVLDAETGGLNSQTDALLEITAITLKMNLDGELEINNTYVEHIEPFAGANIEQSALEINNIQPSNPFRMSAAKPEKEALTSLFKNLRQEQKLANCNRCIMVAHNAAFDQKFIDAAVARCKIKNSPFHLFSNIDTVSLGALAYGQTVLSRCCAAAGIEFKPNKAHSSRYDATVTAKLFCKIINDWQSAIGGSIYVNSEH
jgi:ribonuclease T